MNPLPLDAEWLEADGEGGFASGTVAGYRTRRYHALLLTPMTPPAGRVVLVNGLEAWVDDASGSTPLSTQHYGPDVIHPRGLDHLVAFAYEPWPRWTFRLPDGSDVTHECIVDRVDGSVALTWRRTGGTGRATLNVRPLLSGRDYHALMHENAAFDFSARAAGGNVSWRPYRNVPAIAALSNAAYAHAPTWYRNFLYREEAARGLDCTEDLAAPGTFSFELAAGDAVLVLRAGDGIGADAAALAARIRALEAARRTPFPPPARAALSYVVRRDRGHTIIAGYPWFSDWGRDTFIAMRGLTLARGRLRYRRVDSDRVGRDRVGGHAAQPLPGSRADAGIQRGRCIAVVRGRRRRIHRGRSAGERMCATACGTRPPRSWTATRRGPATAFAWMSTRFSRAACPVCS